MVPRAELSYLAERIPKIQIEILNAFRQLQFDVETVGELVELEEIPRPAQVRKDRIRLLRLNEKELTAIIPFEIDYDLKAVRRILVRHYIGNSFSEVYEFYNSGSRTLKGSIQCVIQVTGDKNNPEVEFGAFFSATEIKLSPEEDEWETFQEPDYESDDK